MPQAGPSVIVYGVNAGFVNSRDQSSLNAGELSFADDAYYKPDDGGIWKVPGRSVFNSTSESAGIKGTRYLEFDGSTTDTLVCHVGTTYRIAEAAETGNFSNLVTGLTGGTTMDSLHYNNEHFLLNGVDRNYVVSDTDVNGNTVNPPASNSTYLHGMLAATTAPTISEDGSETGYQLSTGNTMSYWVEERYKKNGVVIKRSISSSDEVATLTSDGTSVRPVRVTRPTAVNSDATHWALYGTATNGSFPTGAEISEVAIATTFIDDTRTGQNPSLPTGSTYSLWVANVFGTTQTTPKYGPPPIATTGDVFEDSLVLNDSTDPSIIRYSFADDPHAFPAFNFIRFETKEHDEVTIIRRMGDILMVGMRDSLWRVNVLPRPEDAAFDVSRIKGQIEGAFGVVGPYAGTVFSFGQGPRFAYVSTSGVVVANESSWDVLSDDIAWGGADDPDPVDPKRTPDLSKLSNSILVDNPTLYRLEFYYTPVGDTKNTRAYYFHYHPSHAKGGGSFRAKVTGPIRVISQASSVAYIDGIRRVFTSSDAKLWLEGGSDADESDAGGIKFKVRTGDIFPRGLGGEVRIDTLWAHHSARTTGGTATARVVMRNSGDPDVEDTGSISLARREHTKADFTAQAEAMQYGLENSDDNGSFRLNYFAVKYHDLGEEEEG